jgi:hypothetical protein
MSEEIKNDELNEAELDTVVGGAAYNIGNHTKADAHMGEGYMGDGTNHPAGLAFHHEHGEHGKDPLPKPITTIPHVEPGKPFGWKP